VLQAIANGFCSGAVFAVVALGFSLLYSTTRVFNIAHGASYVIGAYVGYLASIQWGLPLGLVILVSALVPAFAALLLELSVFAPLRRRWGSPEVALVASLGVYVVVANAVALAAGNETLFLRADVERTVTALGANLTLIQVLQVLVAAVAITGAFVIIRATSIGRKWRAIADNPELAALLGIDVRVTRAAAVGTAAFLAGLGGVLEALNSGADPNMGFRAVLIASVAAVVGTVGSSVGAAAGGLAIGLLQATGVWFTAARWESTFTFSLLLLALFLKPLGLFGQRRRLEER
jgi:branched-chain amino acid transport system permease protein